MGLAGRQNAGLILAMLLVPGAVRGGSNVWTSLGPDGGYVHALAIDPQNSQTVYASMDTGLFKTTDGGANWSALRPGLRGHPAILKLVIDPQNPGTLYAGLAGPGGVFKSDDGGMTWNQAGLSDAFSPIGSLAIDPRNPQTLYAGMHTGIFKTTDGGQTWTAAGSGLPSLTN